MPREKGRKVIATNRRARHDYHIDATYEAGLVLTGTEVKALRMGRATLTDGYVAIDRGEAWLEAVHIPEYHQGTWTNHAPRRVRKLLLHHDEIEKLGAKVKDGGRTIVPLSLYFKNGYAKVEIALATGKKNYDKRQTIAERDSKRELQREMGRRLKGRPARDD